MTRQRLYSKTDKQIVLACFRAHLAIRDISEKLNIPYQTIFEWHHLFKKGSRSWAAEDDEALIFRQKAFQLFQSGKGYKFVAKELKLPVSRVKYWHIKFNGSNEQFFLSSRKGSRRYSDEKRLEVIDRFMIWTGSKKRFCSQEGLSVGTLNNWLAKEGYIQSKKP